MDSSTAIRRPLFSGGANKPTGKPPTEAPHAPPLEEEAWYVVELPIDPRGGEAVRMVMQHAGGLWLGNNDCAYEDGPIPVDLADYRLVGKVDLSAGA